MQEISSPVKKELRNRLSRMEGQARGVQNMLDQGRSCQEILHQLLAIRSAAHHASLMLIENHALECLRRPDQSESTEEIVGNVMGMLTKLPY
jgi:DNA-binding FrmR family transcriptional regulator